MFSRWNEASALVDLSRLKIDRARAAPVSTPRRSRSRGRWFGRLVLLAVVVAVGWMFRQQILDFTDRLRLPQVTTARVIKPSAAAAGAVTGTASNGYIVARTRAALSADTPGRIIEMNVEEGQAVEKGFVVARLFADELEAALRRAEADLAVAEAGIERTLAEVSSAESDLRRLESARAAAEANQEEAAANLVLAEVQHRRVRKLVDEGFESAQLLDETEAALRSARARVQSTAANLKAAEAAFSSGKSRIEVTRAAVTEARAGSVARRAAADLTRATLDKTIIRAPFDGVVVLKNAEVGEVVSPNSQAGSTARGSVATMVDFSSLEVQAEVPETSLSAVQVGAPARIFLDAFPGRAYSGRVERIWPTADRQKATIEVRVSFEERDNRLRPEMGVRVVFISGDADEASGDLDTSPLENLLLIPADAVVRKDSMTGVFVLERDVVRYRQVKLGQRKSNQVAVEEGLLEDEIIVCSPDPSLSDGDRVLERSTN